MLRPGSRQCSKRRAFLLRRAIQVVPFIQITVIISSATDYRAAARRVLPPFLFHYLDGGAGAEETLRANVDDLQSVKLRQRVMRGSEQLDLGVEWFGQRYDLPIALAPVGLGSEHMVVW